MDALLRAGPALFALGAAGLGLANIVFVGQTAPLVAPPAHLRAFLAFPNLPPLPAAAYVLGAMMAALGVALFFRWARRSAAWALATLYVLIAVMAGLPRVWAFPGDMGLRTVFLQDLAVAALACLLSGRDALPPALERACRYALAAGLVVFGVDHFLALAPIATLVPAWMPAHLFWVAFFGAAFILAGLSLASGWLLRWGAGLAGLMFALFDATLHLPALLANPNNADNCTNVLLVLALCGGLWALARPRHAAGSRA